MKSYKSSVSPGGVPEYEHFTLQPLANGVYAAIATEMGAAFSNAGLVDLGDQTLVFDAFENPQAAEELLQASIQLTKRRPAVAVISHWHPDHWGGLQIFSDCTILATPATRKAMLPIAKEMAQVKDDVAWMEQEIHNTDALLAAESDPQKRQMLEIEISRLRHQLAASDILRPMLPNRTFDGKIVFHGMTRTVELIATGSGHTLSDCVLRLPEDRTAFIGDLGFFQSQPFMAYGFPLDWSALLDEMADWKVKAFVPGHGPVGNKTDLALVAKYIRALEELVQRVVNEGGTIKDALAQTLPAPFDSWQTKGKRFEANIRSSFKRQRRLAGQSN